MKILIAAFACGSDQGSERAVGWNLPLYLAKLGHDVWILTRSAADHPFENTQKELEQLNFPNLHVVVSQDSKWINLCNRYLSIRLLRFGITYLAWQNWAYKTALQLDQDQNFDVFHHLNTAKLSTGSAFRKLGKPSVFGPVGGGQVAPVAFKTYFGSGWKYEALRSWMVQHLDRFNPILAHTLKQTNLVLAINRETADLAKALGGQTDLFLEIGIPEANYPPVPTPSPTAELRLLWVGQIVPRKGLLLALEALSQISPTVPFKLTILGKGSLDHKVAEWIETFQLQNQVIYQGAVPYEEVKAQYQNSDVFLFTSLRDSSGSVLLEAMAAALPIVTLNHQGARDWVPDAAGIKIPVTHPSETLKAIAHAIEDLYFNPLKRLEMGRQAHACAMLHTWHQKALKLSNHYQDLCSKTT
jgi:glycosyltransferase involved in cell wall biosynthesis